jgi:hypothetical protein
MARTASLDEFMSKRRSHVGKTSDGKEVVFKGFKAPPSFNPDERSAEFVMSSERIDRDGDIVRQKGLGIVEFRKNPQGLLFHSSRSWPVGSWSDVKKDLKADPPNTSGKFNFLPAGGPVAEVDQAFWMVQHGAIRTVSIGFMPLDLEVIEHPEGSGAPWSWGYDITKAELYECSLVPIPAQPDAIAKGLIEQGEMAPAREFIEQALDEWARDPRTGVLVPKGELETIYARFFGKHAKTVMGIDAILPREEAALSKVDDAIRQTCDERGIKMPTIEVTDPPAGGEEVEAISGIAINITISQDGGTGSNTRTGTENGDTGTPAADQSVQNSAPAQRSVPEVIPPAPPPKTKLIDALWRRLFGDDKPATQPDRILPGAFKAREQRITAIEARLHASE